jgi:hypothetical protein
LPEGDIVRSEFYTLSLMVFGVAIFATVHALLRRWHGSHSLALGALLAWFFAAVWTAWFVPGVSFLTLWPAVAGLLACAVAGASSQENEVQRWAYLLLFPLALLPILLMVPTLQGFFYGLGLTELGTRAIASLWGASLWLFASQVELITRRGRALVPVLAVLATLALLAGGAWTTRYDAAHPRTSNISYALNLDTHKAVWFTGRPRPDDWTRQFLGEQPRKEQLPEFAVEMPQTKFLVSDAPEAALLAPQVELVENIVAGEERTLRLRVLSPRRAQWIGLCIPALRVVSVVLQEKLPLKGMVVELPSGSCWVAGYLNPPAEGFGVTLQVKGVVPLSVIVLERNPGLPRVSGFSLQRPETVIPIHRGDQTFVRKTFTF